MTKTLIERTLTTDDAAGVVAVHAAMEAAEPVDELHSNTDDREQLTAVGRRVVGELEDFARQHQGRDCPGELRIMVDENRRRTRKSTQCLR